MPTRDEVEHLAALAGLVSVGVMYWWIWRRAR